MQIVSLNESVFLVVLGVVLASLVAFLTWSLLSVRKSRQKLWDMRLTNEERLAELTVRHQRESSQLQENLRFKDLEIAKLSTLLEQKNTQLRADQLRLEDLQRVKEEYIELQAKFAEKEQQLKSRETLLDETKKHLLKEFELAANKLLESRQHYFNQNSRQNIEAVLSPFKQQLADFNKQVSDVYYKENAQRNQLIGQITELQKQARQMSDDAINLTKALKGDTRVQGQWGEIVLERLLEQSGLEKGREYHTQSTFKSDEGKKYRPDVIVHLPEQKDIVIDAKVTLVEYERFVKEADKAKKNQFLKAHVEAIRTHIKALGVKSYEHLEGIRTLDFVFMFIPVEAAYATAVQQSSSLFKEAHDKNIMLVSPSSLMVALKTVATMWRYEKQNNNAEKIANSAGRLYDQIVLLISALEELGGNLDKTHESYNLVFNRLSRGRGNVLKRIEDMRKLGAKTSKTIPKSIEEKLQHESSRVKLLEDEGDAR